MNDSDYIKYLLKRRTIKRLNLPSYLKENWLMELEETIEELKLFPTNPAFNKPGWYYNRLNKESWYELHDGRAFLCNHPEDFVYDFNLLNSRHLEPHEMEAIRTLTKSRLPIGKDLLSMYWWHKDKMMLRETRRNVTLSWMKFKKHAWDEKPSVTSYFTFEKLEN
jgi:hypothetical protein